MEKEFLMKVLMTNIYIFAFGIAVVRMLLEYNSKINDTVLSYIIALLLIILIISGSIIPVTGIWSLWI